MVQLPQPYITTERIIALTVWTLFGKVMSLLFNTVSRFVIAFLPRSSHLLISRLQSPSAVILEPKKRKSVTASAFTLVFAMKYQNSPVWLICLGWPCMVQLIASLSYESPLSMTRQWSMKGSAFLSPPHYSPLITMHFFCSTYHNCNTWSPYFFANIQG